MRHVLALVASLLVSLVALSGCPGHPLFPTCEGGPGQDCPPVEPDYPQPAPLGASLVKACEASCANLAHVGCPEGKNTKCTTACIDGTELRRAKGGFPLTCWTYAADAVAARSCGSLRCVR